MGVELLYGTGNPAKLESMRRWLAPLGIGLTGLSDAGGSPPEVPEDGATPLENAGRKARAYYEVYRRPVFSCDTALYLEGVPDEIQPGIHVRTVGGKRLTDEEMRARYVGLARRYGDLRAYYKNAVCLVTDRDHIYERMDESTSSRPFLLTAETPYSGIRQKGFPLDGISVDIETGKYFYDMGEEELDRVMGRDGFLDFFRKALSQAFLPAEASAAGRGMRQNGQ